VKLLKKICIFLSLVLSLIIVREFIAIYNDLMGISKYLGYSFVAFAIFIIVYFIAMPAAKILAMPKRFGPTTDKNEKGLVIAGRLKQFRKNTYLTGIDFGSLSDPEETYNKAIAVLSEEASKIRKTYVSRVFYGTAVSQNGFLDAVILLSASVNMVKEIFVVYNGRVSNSDLWSIGRKIYAAIAIAGSESVEYITDEIIASFATGGMKSIPFIDKIMGSLTAGFVNTVLVTRISYITENYCKLVYIESDRDLFPSLKVVSDTAKTITNDAGEAIRNAMTNMAVDKAETFAKYVVNPTQDQASHFSHALRLRVAPLFLAFGKAISIFRRR
jgi:hypothetical protein